MDARESKVPKAEEVKAMVRAYCDAHLPGWSIASVTALLGDRDGGQCERLLVLPDQSSSGAAS